MLFGFFVAFHTLAHSFAPVCRYEISGFLFNILQPNDIWACMQTNYDECEWKGQRELSVKPTTSETNHQTESTCLNTSEVRNQAVPVNIDSTLIDKRRKKWAEPRFYGMIPIPMHRCNVTYFLDIKIIVIWREKKSAAFFFTFFSSVIRSCVCVCVYAIGVLRILFFSYIFALYHMKLAHSFEHP